VSGEKALRFAHVSSLTTDLGNTCLYASLACAGTVCLFPREAALDPATFRLLMRQEAIDVLKITPSHFRALLGKPPAPGCFPRHSLLLGGERFQFDLADDIAAQAPPCRVFNHYGPTETTVGAFCMEVTDPGRWRGA
jgi:non-ribosomal peptide synthetase component F